MSDSYQAIYDAVSSRIGRPDIAGAVERVAREALDMGYLRQRAQEAVYMIANEHVRPSVLFRPAVSLDGNCYCVLYGDDLMAGCAGFGATMAEATAETTSAQSRRDASAAREAGDAQP